MIPNWLNRKEYPFTVHTFDTLDGRMSYLDEGRGRPILFLHGNLTWSYLYRDMVAELSDDFRCVAPDFLGFGLSDKPRRGDYTGLGHVQRLQALVDHLQLEDLTVFLHDYGGPIGIEWILANLPRVKNVIVSNTWMWSQNDSGRAHRLASVYSSRLNRIYYHNLRASPRFFMPPLLADANLMPRKMLDQFLMPFENTSEREGAYWMAEGLIKESDWFDSLWHRRSYLSHIPALVLWGKRDEMRIPGELEKWRSVFPLSRLKEFDDVGGLGPSQVWDDYTREIQAFFAFESRVHEL
ncbi:MAG TPA: alpha/beta fold hydrolase [Fimbriimonadaceae bacterium]|nr:alpha/beta fold hydrolase [Fimbriimonadaceae bacterium]